MIFKTIELDEADAAKLAELNNKTQAVQQTMQMFGETMERRMAALQTEGRNLWSTFSQKYGIDLQHVEYRPSNDGKKIIPVRAILQGSE